MDKQQSDHIEHRIQQAAENITPPYNEEGWQRMEVLLDKEFNKKRRRGFMWWWYGLFLCLIIGGGFFYYLDNRSGTSKEFDINRKTDLSRGREKDGSTIARSLNPPATTTIKADTPNEIDLPVESRIRRHDKSGRENKVSIQNSKKTVAPAKAKAGRKLNDRTGFSNNTRIDRRRTGATISENVSPSGNAGSSNNRNKNKTATKISGAEKSRIDGLQRDNQQTGNGTRLDSLVTISNADILQQKSLPADTADNAARIVKADSAANISNISSTDKKDSTIKTGIVKKNGNMAEPGLYLIASIASDGSRVQKFTLDEREPVYGIGIGYRFNNRISLQTGFFAGRKIYTAGAADYKAKPNSYISRYKINSIEADCMIYELPLSFRYDVFARKNFRAYATGGFSSFIMKSENYIYHLTGNMGGYVLRDTTIKGNKNFFSSAAFSVGFEQKILSSLFIQAEPYVRVPLSGVGEGKVKLYSAGLQVGLKYQPVKKKKKY